MASERASRGRRFPATSPNDRIPAGRRLETFSVTSSWRASISSRTRHRGPVGYLEEPELPGTASFPPEGSWGLGGSRRSRNAACLFYVVLGLGGARLVGSPFASVHSGGFLLKTAGPDHLGKRAGRPALARRASGGPTSHRAAQISRLNHVGALHATTSHRLPGSRYYPRTLWGGVGVNQNSDPSARGDGTEERSGVWSPKARKRKEAV